MIEQDTVKLLRECDAGVKMGIASIKDVTDYIRNADFLRTLTDCKDKHMELEQKIQDLLSRCREEGKDPNPVAKGMSWVKTNMKLIMDGSDQTVAELITDGCNMGTKSLNKYLNQYPAADEESRHIAEKLIHLEETLANDIRQYL